jgi:uncharacterized protein
MMPATTIDLGHVARELNLPVESVARTVELLDEGNTVPFITRYRKDLTGGLDEQQIRAIQTRVAKLRQLAERKATILKRIESQGKLTPELAEQIRQATTPKRLEDLYLPFKPKKQTLATLARERGLEPLAVEIFEAREEARDLAGRAATFISADRSLHTVEDVLAGVGHLIAERISENPELRGRLRRVFQRTGKIVCSKVEPPAEPPTSQEALPGSTSAVSVPSAGSAQPSSTPPAFAATSAEAPPPSAPPPQASVHLAEESQASGTPAAEPSATKEPHPSAGEGTVAAPATGPAAVSTPPSTEAPVVASSAQPDVTTGPAAMAEAEGPSDSAEAGSSHSGGTAAGIAASEAAGASAAATATGEATAPAPPAGLPTGRLFEPPPGPVAPPVVAVASKKKKKKKKKTVAQHAFKDYYQYQEPISRVPPHRVLAINRGEKAHALRVKIEADVEAMLREAEAFLFPPTHPHREFLRGCLRDALSRLILPSLEREIRRELTEKAEEHAVGVFVRNLRKLLLQPPTRGRRVLAIDPGFKSGSKMVALDEFGNVLGHGVIFVIGKDPERRARARQRLADMVRQYQIGVIAIGNGTGCRETEQLVADCLAEELKDQDVAYVIVNEAGASIYSTSPLGREELPQYDALLRGAISIGRRLLDPLSEMVKIHPANLGVGLYQHDMKAKHLKDSLDAVVESCVNFVGVDVNSASPALLRYVSGMNALTARRIYEYRREHGPFKNREQLKNVPGIGEQTFIQAAGFLKILGGENPLDATWIHPESYDIARRVLEKLGCDVADLVTVLPPVRKEAKKAFAAELLAPASPADASAAEVPPAAAVPPPEPDAAAALPAGVAASASSSDPALPAATGSPAPAPQPPPGAAALASSDSAAPQPALSVGQAPVAPEQAALGTEQAVGAQVQAAAGDQASPLAGQGTEAPPSDRGAARDASGQPETPAPSGTTSAPRRSRIAERAAQVDIPALAAELGVGTHLLQDILTSLTRPGLDPRDSLPPPVFRRGIMKLEDLTPGMELTGTVLNVVDFGVFVDIGLSDSGLVHISRLADHYIRDPHEVVGVGDVLKVWVVDVDKARRRVSLTAIPPGTQRPPRHKAERKPAGPPKPPAAPAQAGSAAQPPATGRPPRPPRSERGARGRGVPQRPKVIERPPTRPKKIRPITKAMEEGREPLRSFSDLMQLFDKRRARNKPPEEGPPPPASSS